MSAVEQSDAEVDAQLAAEFCRELKLRDEEMASALATWRAARDARDAARDAVEPAKKRAWGAQLRKAGDADEMTRRLEATRDEADRTRRALAAATKRIGEAVEDAESDVLRMRNVTLHDVAAARVERMACATTEHAKAAREEAGLGASPEEHARQRSTEWVAAAPAPPPTPAADPERDPPAPKPAWERLVVTDDDERAILDGTEYRLPRAAGARMLRLLLAARGGLVAAKVIERNISARPKRELGRLPEPIAELVEAPGRDRRGYRLLGALATLATEGRPRP